MGKYLDILRAVTEPKAAAPAISSPNPGATEAAGPPNPATADDPAAEAQAVLVCLKGYTLPAGRIPATRIIVERLRPLLASSDPDPIAALAALQAVEAELIALGGQYDAVLADAIGLVNGAFPGARLVEVKKCCNEALVQFDSLNF